MLYFLPQQSLAFLCFVCARIQIEPTATERTTKSLHAPQWFSEMECTAYIDQQTEQKCKN